MTPNAELRRATNRTLNKFLNFKKVDDFMLTDLTPPGSTEFINGDINMIRVFELPYYITTKFCFNGGHNINFRLVDWFRASEDMNIDGKLTSEAIDYIKDFIKRKNYIRSSLTYLVICGTNDCFLINAIDKMTAL